MLSGSITISSGADVVGYLRYFIEESKVRSVDAEIVAVEHVTSQLLGMRRFSPQEAATAVMQFLMFRRRQISIELLEYLDTFGLDMKRPLAYLSEPVGDQVAIARALYYFRADKDYDARVHLHENPVAALPLIEGGRALDLGCGTGAVAPFLRAHGYTYLHGIDISPEMLDTCAGKGLYDQLTVGGLDAVAGMGS